jgi:hypothetical protein
VPNFALLQIPGDLLEHMQSKNHKHRLPDLDKRLLGRSPDYSRILKIFYYFMGLVFKSGYILLWMIGNIAKM